LFARRDFWDGNSESPRIAPAEHRLIVIPGAIALGNTIKPAGRSVRLRTACGRRSAVCGRRSAVSGGRWAAPRLLGCPLPVAGSPWN